MTGPPRSYTGRRDLIAEKLEPYFQISAMLPKNTRPTSETAEEFWDNSLWCSWGDRETGYTRTVTVSICQVADGEREAEGVRDMMRLECPAGLVFFFKQKTAYEILRCLVGSVVYLSALERLRDFAVFKAIGTPTRSIMAGLALQALVIALLAAVVGVVLAQVLAPLFPMIVAVPVGAYLALPVAAIVIGLFASVAGLKRVVTVDPAQAFGGP